MRKRRKDKTSKWMLSKLSDFFRKGSGAVIRAPWWQHPPVSTETLEQPQPYPGSVSSSKSSLFFGLRELQIGILHIKYKKLALLLLLLIWNGPKLDTDATNLSFVSKIHAYQLVIEHILCSRHCFQPWRYSSNHTDKNSCHHTTCIPRLGAKGKTKERWKHEICRMWDGSCKEEDEVGQGLGLCVCG